MPKKKIMANLIDKISPDEALKILKQLTKADRMIKKRIMEIADIIIRDFDIEEICDDVFGVLNGMDVEELWDRSGSSRFGYVSPEDMAVEMMEEELEPFNQEVIRLSELNMQKEAKLYCMGVLKGIYKFEHESESDYKDRAADVAGECFSYLLDDWKKRSTSSKDIEEMNSFLKKECSRWT